MSSSYSRAPHSTGAFGSQPEAPNAALLIDFDNVTMGMRSDLSKELNNLLNSDIIKGKVTVQRAYADWRRYPQYIVPLSENSVDLIFAPAYGSSKKNATDIRMAIDAIELVFIRPEIGTFILLTGDSDFSSLVLKLKEYGKYVIGVGIQESSSDILVQNCDEYYSYTSLTGLRKTTDSDNKPVDPWLLVEQAVARMASRDDVMRSDRLKQVMIEIDPSFDEGNFGFSKFSRFLSEAGSRDLVVLRKLENGQYEVLPSSGGPKKSGGPTRDDARKSVGRGRSKGKDKDDRPTAGKVRARSKRETRPEPPKADSPKEEVAADRRGDGAQGKGGDDPLRSAYGVLREALTALATKKGGEESVRDSDLKRKMLRLDSSFDEGELGFGKFSRFLRQAHDHEIVDLKKRDDGTYQVSPRGEPPKKEAEEPSVEGRAQIEDQPQRDEKALPEKGTEKGTDTATETATDTATETATDTATEVRRPQRGLGVRRGGTRARKGEDGPPPFLEGQVVGVTGESGSAQETLPLEDQREELPGDSTPSTARTPRGRRGTARGRIQEEPPVTTPPSGQPLDIGGLGLPTDGPALIRYLANSYKGVGQKSAERLVNEFGSGLFEVLHREPERLGSVIRADRVDQLIEGWRTDLERRLERMAGEAQAKEVASKGDPGRTPRRTRRGTRGPGRSGGVKPEKDPS